MKERLTNIARYRFDNFMAKGGSSIFKILVCLFITFLVVLGVLRGLVHAFGLEVQWDGNVVHQLYIVFLQMTDPGNMAQDISSSPWYKLVAILAGIAGIVMLSMLIGFITTALVAKMEELRKGHSKVIEEGHTLILGWNEQRVCEILRELIMANESEDNPSVVILADYPKETMDDYLKLVLPDTQNTRVVTRSGSTSSLANLRVASVETCKSVIILATASEDASRENKNRSDAKCIKTIMALGLCRQENNNLNIVAEIFDRRHHEIVQKNCHHTITVADANDILAKIIVQTSRSVGLSVVYNEILSFDGCEMYFYNARWNGITFGEALYRFPDGVIMGIRKPDGKILLNPDATTVLEADDDVLILAEDDSTIEFKTKAVAVPKDYPLKPGRLEQRIESELIIGWNKKGKIIIEQYADYVLEGSKIDVIVKDPDYKVVREIEQLNERFAHIQIELHDSDPLREESLIAAEPSRRDNIILLSGSKDDDSDAETADSYTILILLLLRRIFQDWPDESIETRLITEVMDSANQSLISEAGVKDFIISNRLISMLFAQMSEEVDIKRVYDNLFEEDGSEIYLKPIATYFQTIPEQVTFADCMAIAQKRKEICLGIKIKAKEGNVSDNFGVKLIPEKNTTYSLQPDDCLIVLSEDDT